MSEAISIDALLRLQMNQAEKDLEKFAKTVRPIDFKVNFKAFGKEVLNISTKGISSKLINTLDQAGDRLTEKLDKTFEKAGKIQFGGGLLGNLTNIITAPLQGLARGAFEGVGREVTRDLGKGISKGIEQELSKSIGGFDFIGKEISSRLTKELLIEIKPLVDVVEKSVKDIFGDRAFKVAQGAVLEQQARERGIQELKAIKGFQRERVRLGDETGIRTGAEFNQALAKLKDKEVELKKVADSIRQKIDTEVDSKGGLEVKQEIEKINADNETIAAKTASLTQKISNARVDVFETIKELQDTTDEKVKQQLESQLDDLQKTIAETETAINKINKEGDLEKLTQQRTSLFSRLDNITRRAIERNQTAIDEFQKSDRALLAEVQKLDEIGKILTTLRDFGVNIRFDELLSSLKVASGDVANLKVSLAKLNAANQTDTQKIQAFVNAKEVETNTELLAKIDEAIAQKYRDIEQRNQQIERLNQDISEATKQVQSLTTQAIAPGVRNQIVTEISQSIANLERSQADIQQEFNQIKNQTDNLSKQRKVLLIRAFEENKEALVNFKRLNKRLILAGAVPGNNVGRSSNSDIATAIEQEVRQTQQEVDKTLQQVYQLVLNQVAQISDVAIDPALIPRLKVAELPQGARGSFESATNTITVSPQAAQTLASGVLDPQFATTLVHELRHAIQSKFGQIDTINTDIDLIKATEEELNKLIHRIEKSVAGAVDLNSNDLAKLKAIEEDAYTFADRYTGQIVNNINQLVFGVSRTVEKSVDNNLDNLIEQIEQQVAQLGQIDLPNLPPIDKDAFLVVESVEQLEKILKEEFSAKGLTQIVKRLGLGAAKNKQQAIEQVTAAYKNDNFKTLELIARLGDDAKLKSAQTGLTSTLGTVDNEQSIREAFKHNQAVVRKIFQQLDQIDQENAQELSDFIRATAKEQIELIDQLQQQYQLTGKTAKSLSGTRSQFAAIFDFETIKNSLGKLESSLELASQAAPQETIAQIEKIEPELKSYLNSVKSLDKTSDVEAVRARLEASYKSLKTAKRLAYEAVEVSAIELAREPVKTVQLLKDSAIAKTKANTQLVVARASNQIANSVASTVENIIDDVKGKLVTTLQGVSRIALPEVQQKALPGSGALTVQTADTVKNILIRAAADVASLIKAGHSNLAAAEKVMLEINPLLKAAKIGLQVSAPVAATTALTTVSPEFAALANGLTGEVAQVLLPLVRHFTLFGFGAEKLAEAAAYLTVFGTAGQVGVKTIEGTAKKVGQAAFDASPQAFQNRLTPENIKAFDAIVAAKQKDIKALAASLSETVQNLKGASTPQTNQKLLTGYQQVTEEISQLEKFLSGSDVRVLKATSDRLKELRQIRDKLATVIDNSAKQVRTSLINLFDVQIEPLSQSNKNSLKLALTSYQQELVSYKQRIEQKILAGKFVDSDLQAGQELARRSQALSRTLINEPGYKRQAKQIAKATQELQSVVNNNLKQDSLQVSDDVINGILMGATSKLQDVGRNMGQDLLLGFRKELGIQSPSKKMMEQMEYIIAGLVQSQTEKQQLLEKIGRNLALGVEKGWQSGELNFAEQIEFKNLITRERNNLGAEPTKAYLAAFQKDLAEIEQGFSYWERIENQHLMQREARKAEAIASERRMHFGLEEPSFAYISKIQSQQFDSLSKSIIDGVTKGVDKSLKNVEQQGEKIGNRLLKGFRTELGIKSPSQEMIQNMDYVVEGLIQGQTKNSTKLNKIGQKIGKDLTSNFNPQEIFNSLFKEASNLSGVHLDQKVIPRIEIGSQQLFDQIANPVFVDFEKNIFQVTEEIFNELTDISLITKNTVDTLTQNIRGILQSDFGKISPEQIAKGKSLELILSDFSNFEAIQKNVNQEIQKIPFFANKDLAAEEKFIESAEKEQDAYIFALRHAQSAFEELTQTGLTGNKAYKALFDKIANIEGIDPADLQSFIPNLIPDSNRLSRLGAQASYQEGGNVLRINSDDFNKLNSGDFSVQLIDTILHELRHAFQTSFGQDQETFRLIQPVTPNDDELAKVKDNVLGSARSYAQQYLQIVDRHEQQARIIFEDSLQFAEKYEKNFIALLKNIEQKAAMESGNIANAFVSSEAIQNANQSGEDLGSSIIKGFEDRLGINSPSKVFIKQVKFITQGIEQGINTSTNIAFDAGGKLGAAIVKGYQRGISQIGSISKKELVKEGLVNGVGFAAGKAATIATGGIPGVGTVTELGASLFTRKAVTDIETTLEVFNRIVKDETNQLDSNLTLLTKVIREAAEAARRKSQRTRKDLDQDATGFAIGNLAASTSQAVGANIPLVGAATAIATTKSAIALRNQIIEQVDVNQLINAVSDGIVVAVGTNAAKIKNQGHRIGNEIIQGFKDELGIRSPAQRFIDEAKWIVKAIVIASEISYSKLKRTGRKLGENIVTGFEEATRNNRVARSLKEIERETQRAERAAANSIRVPIFNRIKGKAQETLTQVRKLGEQIKASLAVGLSRQSGTTIFQQLIAQSEILTARINANAAVADRAFMEGNRAAERTARNVNRQINSIGNQSETLFSRIRRLFRANNSSPGFFDKLQAQLDKVGITAQRVKNTVKGLIALTVGSVFLGGIDQVARDVFDVGVRFEQLENRIDFAAGSAEKGAIAFAKVSNEARRLKVDIEQAMAGYASLAASTKNNDVLRGETDKILRVVTQASRVMGSTAQQTESAFLAIRQMIDTGGTIQIEELKQLGESGNIQGVFGLAQKAIGAADGELRKLISSGSIATEDFLPKFIDELDRATRSGLSASLRTTSAALQDLRNEYKLLQVALSKELNQTTSTTLDLIASALEITRNNLDKIIPVLKVTAALLAIALLPSALTLGKFLTGALVTGLKGGISLLVQTNTQLAATNFQLTFLASTSPKIAALISIIGKLQVALKLAAVAAKAFLLFEGLTVLIGSLNNTRKAGDEARNSIKSIEQAIQDLDREVGNLKTENIARRNQKAVEDSLNWYQKFTDGTKKLLKENNAASFLIDKTILGFLRFGGTFAEAQLSRIEAATGDVIKTNQKLLQKASQEIGITNLTDKATKDIKDFVAAINISNQELDKTLQNAVSPHQIALLNEELRANNRLLDLYNQELKKRGDRELNLAKINITKEETVKAATEAELAAIAAIEEEMLRSGDFKQDIELVKLQAAETRLKTELEAERKQLAQIKELAATKGGIDPDTGKPRNSQQLEDFEKTEKRIIELTRSSIENRQALLRKETEQKLAEYDRYLEEAEGRRQEAEEQSIAAEKERLIELQQLYNQDLISQQDFERLKVASSKEQVASQLDEEKRKLRELKKFKTKEKVVQEKVDQDIKASKTKVLDLTLELLQQEKQATEDTINAIAESRDNVFSALKNRLNRLQQIQQTEAQLVSDRATAEEKLGDLQVAKLRQALELRKQINSGDLNDNERRTALRQLRDLGVQGRTSEIALLNQIKDKEQEIAAQKLATLLKQQEFAQTQLEIENELLRISTKKAEIEAKKGLNEAEKQLNSAETAIATAETQAEFDQANKLYNLALDSYQIAQDEVNLTQQQANSLEDIINKKQENLELTQAIARAEARAEGKEQKAEVEKELNAARESRDRRLGRNLDKYLSTQEKIDREVEGRRQRAESRGQDFTEEDEQKLRRRLMKAEGKRQRAEGRRFATSKPFTITAPPEILEAIRTGKPITVPAIAPFKSTAPLQTTTIERNDPNSDRVLQVLKKIETKFKQPTVIKVQNDNQFVNQYQRSDTDEILRQMRSEQVDILNNIAQTYD